jgi:hypothetical protein
VSRPLRLALIALGVIVFLLVSGLLARFLSTENDERDADLGLLQAEAAGDAPRLIGLLSGCRVHPRCVATQEANAARLRRRGAVKILDLTSHTAYSVTGATGQTRIAWTVIGRLPVVQCVTVRRTGTPISGLSVTLLGLSAPIPNMGVCTGR